MLISGYEVLIDEEDYSRISQYKWYVDKAAVKKNRFYFAAYLKSTSRTSITLHRFIMGCVKGDGKCVDHINGNTLDNRKCNLRIATQIENNHNTKKHRDNTTGYKSVCREKNGSYTAKIKYNGIVHHVGSSVDPILAAKMYGMIAIKVFGEFANTNFPKDTYSAQEIDDFYARYMKHIPATNKTGYRGVTYNSKNSTWTAMIYDKRKCYNLGKFHSPEEAARAYNAKAIELKGQKAILNDIKEVNI